MGDNPSSCTNLFVQRVFPHKSLRRSESYGKREAVKSKIKSAIPKEAYKKAQVNDSANQSKNKRIADFIFAKERSDFRK